MKLTKKKLIHFVAVFVLTLSIFGLFSLSPTNSNEFVEENISKRAPSVSSLPGAGDINYSFFVRMDTNGEYLLSYFAKGASSLTHVDTDLHISGRQGFLTIASLATYLYNVPTGASTMKIMFANNITFNGLVGVPAGELLITETFPVKDGHRVIVTGFLSSSASVTLDVATNTDLFVDGGVFSSTYTSTSTGSTILNNGKLEVHSAPDINGSSITTVSHPSISNYGTAVLFSGYLMGTKNVISNAGTMEIQTGTYVESSALDSQTIDNVTGTLNVYGGLIENPTNSLGSTTIRNFSNLNIYGGTIDCTNGITISNQGNGKLLVEDLYDSLLIKGGSTDASVVLENTITAEFNIKSGRISNTSTGANSKAISNISTSANASIISGYSTISGGVGSAIYNSGKLEIKDNALGEMPLISSAASGVGSGTVGRGTIVNSSSTGLITITNSEIRNTNSSSSVVINNINNARLIFNSGYIGNTTANSSSRGIYNYTGQAEINGGFIMGVYYGVSGVSNSRVTVSGTASVSGVYGIDDSYGTVIVNGGIVTSDSTSSSRAAIQSANGTVTITGGRVESTGTSRAISLSEATLNISETSSTNPTIITAKGNHTIYGLASTINISAGKISNTEGLHALGLTAGNSKVGIATISGDAELTNNSAEPTVVITNNYSLTLGTMLKISGGEITNSFGGPTISTVGSAREMIVVERGVDFSNLTGHVYDGSPKYVTATPMGIISDDTAATKPVLSYLRLADSTICTEMLNAGSYDVSIAGDKVEAYTFYSDTTPTVSVAKGDASNLWQIDGCRYNESLDAPYFLGNDVFYFEVEIKVNGAPDSTYQDAYIPTEVGSYVMRITYSENSNYADGVAIVEFSIHKGFGVGTLTMASWAYGETSANFVLESSTHIVDPSEYIVLYVPRGGQIEDYTWEKPTTPGEYTIAVGWAEDANYEEFALFADFEIYKGVGVGSVSMAGWTFGGTAASPSASSATNGITNGSTISYSYKIKDAADSTYGTTKPTDSGDYTVRAVFSENSLYQAVTATSNFTITKALYSGSSPSAEVENVTKNSITVKPVTGAEYSIDGGDTWQDSNVFEDLSGNTNYDIQVRIKGTSNSLPSSSNSLSIRTKGLSGGAIAGIVIGSVVVVAIGGFAIFWFIIKKKNFADLKTIFKKSK